MADFDPDAYLKVKQEGAAKGFDPDIYLAEKQANRPPPISTGRAATLGFANGGTFGFVDELGGLAAKGLPTWLGGLPEPVKVNTAADAGDAPDVVALKQQVASEQASAPTNYELVRDRIRAEQEQAKQEHGGAYLAGEIGGGVASSMLPGMRALGSAGQGLGAAARFGRAAMAGAALGGLYGVGSSNADVSRKGDYGRLGFDTGTGAALGAAGGALGEGVATGVKAAAPYVAPYIDPITEKLGAAMGWTKEAMEEFARNRVLKAMGYIKSDLGKLQEGRAGEIANDLLAEGVNKNFRNARGQQPGLEAMRKKYGEEIETILSNADAKTGGTGGEVRAQVAGRKAEDAALREADAEATGMYRQSAETAVAEELAKRQQWREATKAQLMPLVEQASARRGLAPFDAGPLTADIKGIARLGATTKAGEGAAAMSRQSKALDDLVARLEQEQFGGFNYDSVPSVANIATPKGRSAAIGGFVNRAEAGAIPAPEAGQFTEGLGFDGNSAAGRLRSLLPHFDIPGYEGQFSKLEQLIGTFSRKAESGMSFSEANGMKSALQDTISNFADVPAAKKVVAEAQNALKREIDDQIAAKVGSSERDAFQVARRKYGSAASTLDANAKAIDRDAGNRLVSLSDYLAALAGGGMSSSTGSMTPLLMTTAGSVAHKLVRQRGSSVAANLAKGAANRLDSVRLALQNSPDLLGQFAPALSRAAQSGERSLATTHYILAQQSPEYRERIDQLADR